MTALPFTGSAGAGGEISSGAGRKGAPAGSLRRAAAFCLVLLLLTCQLFSLNVLGAEDKNRMLTMAAARAMAVEESTAYFKAEEAIISKQASLESAKKSIRLKQKNMSTFRWSPLINFKFPTKPTEAESYEFQFKPIQIQAEIDEAVHKLTDTKLSIYEEINTLYVDIVVLQKTIAFNETRLETLSEGLKRNRARLAAGEATQADVDALEKKKETAESKVAADRRTLAAKLKKLSGKVGTNVETGYDFETPFLTADIGRDQLPALIQYTLDRDETYYNACMDETTARASLNTNYSLFTQHYGGDSRMISSYVQQALNGEKVNARAFKSDYKAFLEKIDSYWQGKKKILFIKVPKLWFKGALDGTRYIEDDPEVLYEDVMSYSEARTARIEAEANLEEQVIDTFETYISTRNSYNSMAKDLDKAEADLAADLLRNRLGLLTFEEYSAEQDDYEELQNSFFELMQTYSQTLYSFDRLTCGGISAFLSGENVSMQAGETGTSYVEKDMAEGASYSLKQIVQNEAFELSVYIPEDFEVEVTHFELWCDSRQVGDRTEKGKRLRHLALATDGVDTVKIRLYNEEEFVDDCVIDPEVSSGPLSIVADRRVVKGDTDELGVYEFTSAGEAGLMSRITIKTSLAGAAFYEVKTKEGVVISGKKPVAAGQSFSHLSLIEEGLPDLRVTITDRAGSVLGEGRFDTANRKILRVHEDAEPAGE